MQDYMNGAGGFNTFQQALHQNYPGLGAAQAVQAAAAASPPDSHNSTTPASVSSVSPGSGITGGAGGGSNANGSNKGAVSGNNNKPKIQRKKKKKDPNEPQKPVSAYALFFRDTQAAIRGQNPNATFGQVSKIVASMWDQLDAERKEVYKKKTEAAKKEYLKALAAYRASLVQSPQSSASPSSSQQSARSPINASSAAAASASQLASSLNTANAAAFNANHLMNSAAGLGFSQAANGNLAGLPNLQAMAAAGGQNLAQFANFSGQMPQWGETASSRLAAAASFGQNWPPAAHTNAAAAAAHNMYLGVGAAQMHALSSQLGMVQPPWDAHRGR